MTQARFLTASALMVLTWSGATHAATYAESSQGDASDNPSAPTELTLSFVPAGNVPGSNVITGTVGRHASGTVDRDYFHVVVPPGFMWSELRVGNQVTTGGSQGSFIGLAAGNALPVPPSSPSANGLLGWTLYNASQATTDILDNMAQGHPVAGGLNGASGFTSPLAAGDYTLWIQETAPGRFNYRFNLVLTPVPEPSALVLGMLGLCGVLGLRGLRTR